MSASDSDVARQLFDKVKHFIYDETPGQLLLGYPAEGVNNDQEYLEIYKNVLIASSLLLPLKHVSGYYSSNISKEDVDLIHDFLVEQDISELNTRLFKSDDGKNFTVKIASALETKPAQSFTYKG